MHRRSFLKSAAATVALTPVSQLLALDAANPYRKNIGIQLYTLRGPIGKDLAGTLKAVAAAGYKQVEPYGFPGAGAMIAAAKDNGLAVNSSHFDWDSAINPKDDAMSDFRKILDQAKAAGLSHLVIPFIADKNRRTLDDYRKVAENANKAAAIARTAGIQLAYHNHSFEFEPKTDGKSGYDVFIEEFSDDMKFEVDVFWVKVAGHDPAELIRKLKGRVSQLHLKDLKDGIKTPHFAGNLPADAFQELGDGVIPMAPVLAAAAEAGVTHCHVEQDQSPDPLASIAQSVGHLAKL
jgi:sugar phosphate isomerase/epimerase